MTRLEDVAGSAEGMDQLRVRIAVDGAPQSPDVDLDEVREGIELLVPDVFGDLLAPDDAAGVSAEVFEQRVLLRRQRQLRAGARDAVRARVDAEVGDLDDG